MKRKTCVCGCGRRLKPGETGHNFATPACVLRVLAANPRLREQLGAENIQTAIEMLERKDQR